MRRLLLLAVSAATACGGDAVEPVPEEPATCTAPLCDRAALDALGAHPFYMKYVNANGIPVISSENVEDRALLVAKEIVEQMLAHREDVRVAMVTRGAYVGIMSRNEMTTDIPEHRPSRERPRCRLEPACPGAGWHPGEPDHDRWRGEPSLPGWRPVPGGEHPRSRICARRAPHRHRHGPSPRSTTNCSSCTMPL